MGLCECKTHKCGWSLIQMSLEEPYNKNAINLFLNSKNQMCVYK